MITGTLALQGSGLVRRGRAHRCFSLLSSPPCPYLAPLTPDHRPSCLHLPPPFTHPTSPFPNLFLSLFTPQSTLVPTQRCLSPPLSSHPQSIQMTGGSRTLVWGDSDPITLKPSVAWLRNYLLGPDRHTHGTVKMVAVINPNNPTGEVRRWWWAGRAGRAAWGR